jgi:hypothetical protein
VDEKDGTKTLTYDGDFTVGKDVFNAIWSHNEAHSVVLAYKGGLNAFFFHGGTLNPTDEEMRKL